MKNKSFYFLLFTFYFLTSFQSYGGSYRVDQNTSIPLTCVDSICDIDTELKIYLESTDNPPSSEQLFFLFDQGVVVDSRVFSEYLANINHGNLFSATDVPTTNYYDGGINCQYDRDYSCQDWDKYDYTKQLREFLSSQKYSFIVTQRFLDLKARIDWIERYLIDVALALPAGRLAKLAGYLSPEQIRRVMLETFAGVGIGRVIAAKLDEAQTWQTWGKRIELGDKIVYQGNGHIYLEKQNGTKVTLAGTSANSGSGSGGSTGGSFGSNDGVYSTGISRTTVCTGTLGSYMYCRPMYL